jgi:purine-binding chemotaxis protein CheW
LAGKYLTFILGHESYAIPVLKVREIIQNTAVTGVPQLPGYMKGVINLRGKIIPVLDLRLRLGLEEIDASETTCIIVARIDKSQAASMQIGLIVDGVEEVANISGDDIEPTPEFGCQLETSVILGMAKIKGVVKTLLDIDRVVRNESDKRILTQTPF